MHQIDVALTDYALTTICLWFAYRLWYLPSPDNSLPRWQQNLWIIFFISLAFGSLTGGTVHGFFADVNSLSHRALWITTVFAIGCTASIGWLLIGTFVAGTDRLRTIWGLIALVDFIVYGAILSFYSASFLVAILNYAPAMAVLMIVSLRSYFRTRTSYPLWIASGLAVSFLAAFVQQAQIALHPSYFDHNSTFHAVQAVGLLFVYWGARGLSEVHETSSPQPQIS